MEKPKIEINDEDLARLEEKSSDFSVAEENPILNKNLNTLESVETEDFSITPVVEKKKSNFKSKKFLVNIVVIIALAVFSGVQVGLLYLDMFVKSYAPPSIAEETLRDDAVALFTSSTGKTPDQVSPIEAVVIADYILTNCTMVQKNVTGSVTAMGVNQGMTSVKKRVGNTIFTQKLSTGILSVGNKFTHELGSDVFEFYSSNNVTLEDAVWPSEPSYYWDYATYIDHFRSKPEYFINYVISSKTVISASMQKLDGGNYKVSMDLDSVYSVINYLYEIRETSGSSKYPSFKSIHVEYVMDSSFRMLSATIDETYDVAVPQLGGGYVETHALMNEVFIYEGVTL